MSKIESNNKRLVKNTILLYLRMLFTMAVGLYTSRLILSIVGVSDYGIYNIVGGIVILISIINNSLAEGTQRFITFEIGKGDWSLVSKSFSLSMTAHLLIAGIIFLLGETIGLYYIINYLNIPDGREVAAIITYQLSLLTIISSIVRTPYQASVIAYEDMTVFAYIGFLETFLKLILVLCLRFFFTDKLIGFAILVLLVSIVSTELYRFFCKKHYDTCSYSPQIDRTYFKKMMSFFGWNFVGTLSTIGSTQAGNLIINYFCGTIVNAAYGVATQVNSALNSLVGNFQTAFTPQIVKYYSQENLDSMFLLMRRTALLSFYLLFLFSLPVIFRIDYVLGVWLEEVPPYSGVFVILLICYNLIDSLQAPLWKAIIASGDIKVYEIWLNAILIMNIPISYFLLRNGAPPYAVLATSVALNFISAIVRTIHVKIQLGFKIAPYLKDVVMRATFVVLISVGFTKVVLFLFEVSSLVLFLLYCLVVCTFTLFVILLVGVNTNDRSNIVSFITNKIFKSHEVS